MLQATPSTPSSPPDFKLLLTWLKVLWLRLLVALACPDHLKAT
jgi:hypothetical protein